MAGYNQDLRASPFKVKIDKSIGLMAKFPQAVNKAHAKKLAKVKYAADLAATFTNPVRNPNEFGWLPRANCQDITAFIGQYNARLPRHKLEKIDAYKQYNYGEYMYSSKAPSGSSMVVMFIRATY